MKSFKLLSPKRYFHLIAFKGDTKVFDNNYLKFINVKPSKKIKDFSIENMDFKQMELFSDKPFNIGSDDFSLLKDGKAPFVYDFVLMTMKDKGISFFCFPFKKMSKKLVLDLLTKHSFLKYGKFLKVKLNELIEEDTLTDYLTKDISYHFNSIELSLPGEVNLSTVKLDGDKPLDSLLYKEVFKEKIANESSRVEKVSLKCNSAVSDNENIPNERSTFHIDKYGNYKLYVQKSGLNLITVPLVFYSILEKKCFLETSNNPTLALTNNESEL